MDLYSPRKRRRDLFRFHAKDLNEKFWPTHPPLTIYDWSVGCGAWRPRQVALLNLVFALSLLSPFLVPLPFPFPFSSSLPLFFPPPWTPRFVGYRSHSRPCKRQVSWVALLSLIPMATLQSQEQAPLTYDFNKLRLIACPSFPCLPLDSLLVGASDRVLWLAGAWA